MTKRDKLFKSGENYNSKPIKNKKRCSFLRKDKHFKRRKRYKQPKRAKRFKRTKRCKHLKHHRSIFDPFKHNNKREIRP